MNHNLTTWIVVVLALAFLFALLWFSKRVKRKLGMEPHASKVSTKFILLSIALLGALAGSFFSSALNVENMWARLFYSLIIFFVIGVPEVLLIRRLRNKLSLIYMLDGQIFPFFAVGFSCAIFSLS
jgi:hypothetical protein